MPAIRASAATGTARAARPAWRGTPAAAATRCRPPGRASEPTPAVATIHASARVERGGEEEHHRGVGHERARRSRCCPGRSRRAPARRTSRRACSQTASARTRRATAIVPRLNADRDQPPEDLVDAEELVERSPLGTVRSAARARRSSAAGRCSRSAGRRMLKLQRREVARDRRGVALAPARDGRAAGCGCPCSRSASPTSEERRDASDPPAAGVVASGRTERNVQYLLTKKLTKIAGDASRRTTSCARGRATGATR